MDPFPIRLKGEAVTAIGLACTHGLYPRLRGEWIRDASGRYLAVRQLPAAKADA